MKRISRLLIIALMLSIPAIPASAQSIGQAAQEIEAAIHDAMAQAGQGSTPTLGQLGGVQAGSTSSDAGGGAGGDGSSGGSGGSGGSSGGNDGGSGR